MFTKDAFDVDLDADAATCPAGQTVPIRRGADGAGTASFGETRTACPLREQCTRAAGGRTVGVGVYEPALARARQTDPG